MGKKVCVWVNHWNSPAQEVVDGTLQKIVEKVEISGL